MYVDLDFDLPQPVTLNYLLHVDQAQIQQTKSAITPEKNPFTIEASALDHSLI